MNIQNISGPDVIPEGLSVSSNYPVERTNSEKIILKEGGIEDENKGKIIDSYA